MGKIQEYTDKQLQDEIHRRKFKHITPPIEQDDVVLDTSIFKKAHQEFIELRMSGAMGLISDDDWRAIDSKRIEIADLLWDVLYKESKRDWLNRLRRRNIKTTT